MGRFYTLVVHIRFAYKKNHNLKLVVMFQRDYPVHFLAEVDKAFNFLYLTRVRFVKEPLLLRILQLLIKAKYRTNEIYRITLK